MTEEEDEEEEGEVDDDDHDDDDEKVGNFRATKFCLPGERKVHPSFAAAGANAFALEKYLQVQNKLNCSGKVISHKHFLGRGV